MQHGKALRTLNVHAESDNGSPTSMSRKILIIADTMIGPTFWKTFMQSGRQKRGDCYEFLFFSNERLRAYRKFFPDETLINLSEPSTAYGHEEQDIPDLERRARQFEETHDSSIMDILQADRHLGRGLYYLGHRHMESRLTGRANYWSSVKLVVDLADRLREELTARGVNVVVLTGVASLVTKLTCVVARTHGIPLRMLSPGRAGNLYYWAEDEYMQTSALTWRPSETTPRAAASDTEGAGADELGKYVAIQRIQRSFRQNYSLPGVAVRIVGTMVREIEKSLVLVLRGRKLELESYFSWQRIQAVINVYVDYRRYQAVLAVKGSRIPDRFVFLPLHAEPEAALMVLSPEFNNQLATIDQIAKALPSGVFLLVKENPIGIGRRPKGFYKWLASIPNVRLAPLEIDGCYLAQKSHLTVTITGTAGLEAAVAGVPVITFGCHNLYNRLDHVRLGTDFGKLGELVRELLAMSQEQRATAAGQGRQFFNAIRELCVDLGEGTLTDGISPRLLEEAFVHSLDHGLAVSDPASA